jgi:hypothetical protein
MATKRQTKHQQINQLLGQLDRNAQQQEREGRRLDKLGEKYNQITQKLVLLLTGCQPDKVYKVVGAVKVCFNETTGLPVKIDRLKEGTTLLVHEIEAETDPLASWRMEDPSIRLVVSFLFAPSVQLPPSLEDLPKCRFSISMLASEFKGALQETVQE